MRLQGAAWALTAAIPLFLILSRVLADAVVVLVGALFLLHSVHVRDWGWLERLWVRVSLLVWGWILLVVTPLAIEPAISLERALGWIRYPLFLTAVVTWVAAEPRHVRRLCVWQAALLALVAMDTLIQYATGMSLTGRMADGERLTGPLNNVKVGIYTVKMALPIFGVLLAWALLARRMGAVVGVSAFLLALVAVVLLTGERTAFLTFMLALATAGVVLVLKYRPSRMPFLVLALVSVALVGALYQTQPGVRIRGQLLAEHLTRFWDSPYGHVFTAATTITSSYWLTGAGLRGFREACVQVMEQGIVPECQPHPHNYYLEWLTEAGLPGLLGFLALIGALFLPVLSALKRARAVNVLIPAFATATFVVHFFPFVFSQSMFSNWPAILLWYSLSMAMATLVLVEDA